jgi:hypothetical protein
MLRQEHLAICIGHKASCAGQKKGRKPLSLKEPFENLLITLN